MIDISATPTQTHASIHASFNSCTQPSHVALSGLTVRQWCWAACGARACPSNPHHHKSRWRARCAGSAPWSALLHTHSSPRWGRDSVSCSPHLSSTKRPTQKPRSLLSLWGENARRSVLSYFSPTWEVVTDHLTRKSHKMQIRWPWTDDTWLSNSWNISKKHCAWTVNDVHVLEMSLGKSCSRFFFQTRCSINKLVKNFARCLRVQCRDVAPMHICARNDPISA